MPAKEKTFKNSNIPNSNSKLPKGKIEKIELSEEDKDDIKRILEGKPSKEKIEKWEKSGRAYYNYEKRYNPGQLETRIKKIKDRYFGGLCHICDKFPLYKVSYKMPGIKLVEYYCQEHIDKII